MGPADLIAAAVFAKYDSFLGHSSGAWAAYGTFLLFAGAVLAWLSSQRQVSELREARRDDVRPLVHIRKAGIFRRDNHQVVGVRVVNVGQGPAMNVVLHAWLAVPADSDDPSWMSELERCKSEVDFSKPDFILRLGALGAAESLDVALTSHRKGFVNEQQRASAHGALLYMAYYENIHKESFPRPETLPLGGSDLGSVKFARFNFTPQE